MLRCAVGAAVVPTAIWLLSLGAAAPAAAQSGGPAVPVTAETVTAEDVPVFLHGIGTVQAYNTVAVKSRVDGQIVKIDFKEGQEVKEGDPLLQIDPRPYQAAHRAGEAVKQKDEAQLAGAQARPREVCELARRPATRPGRATTSRRRWSPQLQAAIKGDEAQIQTAKLNLGYADIRSPIDGRLGARLVERATSYARPTTPCWSRSPS